MKVFRYVIAHDTGLAPNYAGSHVTLALCKPNIRRLALKGDLVIAFAGAGLNADPDAVVWAGIVSEILEFGVYWDDPRFASKKARPGKFGDNIYEPHPGCSGGFIQHGCHHNEREAKARDLRGRNALVFERPAVWRFEKPLPKLPQHFDLAMSGGRRGHQVCELDATVWYKLRHWFNGQKLVPTEQGSREAVTVPSRRRRAC